MTRAWSRGRISGTSKGLQLLRYPRSKPICATRPVSPITAAEILNDRVVPFYDEHRIRLSRVLTDRGPEFCGSESHEYELYLAVEDIDHSRTKTKSPQTNGICERFHRTVLDEFYRVAFRKKIYRTIEELQTDPGTGVPGALR